MSRPIRHNQLVITTVIIYTQDHSDATRGNHVQSRAITSTQTPQEAITCNHVHSDATRGNQRQSRAITCNHVHSEAIRGNHVQSRAITSTQRPSADPLITALHTAKRSRCFASFEM